MDLKSKHLQQFINIYWDSNDLEYTLGLAVLREIVFMFDGDVSRIKTIKDEKTLNIFKANLCKEICSDLVTIKINGNQQTSINSENVDVIYSTVRNTLAHNIVSSTDYSTSDNSKWISDTENILTYKPFTNSGTKQITYVLIKNNIGDKIVEIKINPKKTLIGNSKSKEYKENSKNLKKSFLHLQELMLHVVSTALITINSK